MGDVVDPSKIPVPQARTPEVYTAGLALKTDGTNIAQTGNDIHSDWQGLSPFYISPEANLLLAATRPVATAGDNFKTALHTAGDALTQFATEAGPILSRLRTLKGDAQRLQDKTRGDDDWRKDEDDVDENNRINNQVLVEITRYMAAERECANKITALFGGTTFVATKPGEDATLGRGQVAHGFTEAPQNVETPWGKPQEHDKPWYQDVWDGVWDFGAGLLEDVGSLVGLYGENGWVWAGGEWGDWWGNVKDGWGGMFQGFAGMVGFYGPDGWGWQGWGNLWNNWKELGHSFVPWREWGDRPGYVLTQSVLNIGSIFVGGAGLVKGIVTAGKRIGRRGDSDAPDADAPDDPVDSSDLPDYHTDPNRIPTVGDLQDLVGDLELDDFDLGDFNNALNDAGRFDDLPGNHPDNIDQPGNDRPADERPPPREPALVGADPRPGEINGNADVPGEDGRVPALSGAPARVDEIGGNGGNGGELPPRGGNGGNGGFGGELPPRGGSGGTGGFDGELPPRGGNQPPGGDTPNPPGDGTDGPGTRPEPVDRPIGQGDPLSPDVDRPFGEGHRLDPNTRYEVTDADGRDRGVFITGPNGRIIEIHTNSGRSGEWNPDLRNPLPNVTYHIDGRYHYRTDADARTVHAEGELHHTGSDNARRMGTDQSNVGWDGRNEYRAHNELVGRAFEDVYGRRPGPGEFDFSNDPAVRAAYEARLRQPLADSDPFGSTDPALRDAYENLRNRPFNPNDLVLYEDVRWNGGHLFGTESGGAGERFNMVPMLEKLNQGQRNTDHLTNYRRLEEHWRALLKSGKKVYATIDVEYRPGTSAPQSITVEYSIDGVLQDPITYENVPPRRTS
ncbi:hypothetical protein DPM19_22025 [Actinomadura craniellae]|uniref:Type VII secretion system protein EssD-like domain-containing protein n=1 Tax=Actinomadura craniellae TaxID=2231787 RepID=A0A365H249_9ACTN|nr:DNA/RNA non-specific endonuclease [Actinomadura craniellae]RAY13170.1 hypothetical protein DPM19_22025 [Actinomadura craniellae]